jgi:orotidine-5'-phosphate decarboxylase
MRLVVEHLQISKPVYSFLYAKKGYDPVWKSTAKGESVEPRNFMKLLSGRWDEGCSICIGLDSKLESLPEAFRKSATKEGAQFSFNMDIVNATADIAVAYKPNVAFYPHPNLMYGLRDAIAQINRLAPQVPVILDFKQGDIDSSNDGYVELDFDFFGADAVVVHPTMGSQAMAPYLKQANKGVFVLCKTSNKGSAQFQDVKVRPWRNEDGVLFANSEEATEAGYEGPFRSVRSMEMYRFNATVVKQRWNTNGNCGLVVGATYPEPLKQVRKIVGDDFPILMPGVGAQQGDLEAALFAGIDSNGRGLIINSSRGIIFSKSPVDAARLLHHSVRLALAA